MIVFQVSLNFDPVKEILRIDLHFNKEVDYSEENAIGNKDFRSTIREPFQFEPEQKKILVMRAMRKKLHNQPFADICQNRCSKKFRKIQKKKPVLTFFFFKKCCRH